MSYPQAFAFASLALLLTVGGPSALAQTTVSSSDIKGGVVSSQKGNNIFDSSAPTSAVVEKPQPKPAPAPKPQAAKVQTNAGAVAGLPSGAIDTQQINSRANSDPSIMQAIEQSRKLRERLGVVGTPINPQDAGGAIDGVKDSIEKQKKLEEEQKYRF